MTDTKEDQLIKGIPRDQVLKLAAYYKSLDAIREQIEIVNHNRMPGDKLRLDLGNGNYATSILFTYDEIMEILVERREKIVQLIWEHGGQV